MKIEEIKLTETFTSLKITPDEGKMLINKLNNDRITEPIILGYIYYDKDSNLLNPPKLETLDDFEEVDYIPEEVNYISEEENNSTEVLSENNASDVEE